MTISGKYLGGELAWALVDCDYYVDQTGTLGVAELGSQFDFEVKRVFFLREVAPDATRGMHSHECLKQFLICLSGSMVIHLDTGTSKSTLQLTKDGPGLFIDGRVWRSMTDFTKDLVVLVLCDRQYQFDKVVRNYEDFLSIAGSKSK